MPVEPLEPPLALAEPVSGRLWVCVSHPFPQVIRRLVHTDNVLYYVNGDPDNESRDPAKADDMVLALNPDYVLA